MIASFGDTVVLSLLSFGDFGDFGDIDFCYFDLGEGTMSKFCYYIKNSGSTII